MIDLLLKVLGDPNARKIKKIQPTVEYINSLEPEISQLSDEELKAKTAEFKQRYQERQRSDDY